MLERARGPGGGLAVPGGAGRPYEADVDASSDRVVVTLRTRVATAFLRLVGITAVFIEATAPAECATGSSAPTADRKSGSQSTRSKKGLATTRP